MSINAESAGGRQAPSSLPAARVPDGLPLVPMETVSIHEMAKVLREQTAALKACGETLIRQQDQLTQIAQHVVVVRQSISPVDYGPSKGPNKVPGKGPATPIEGGHPGYTVKEMATLIHRSIWYVYRRVRSGEYAVTHSGRITHESYLKAMTRLAFIQKKQRRKKW